jgi:hypothetical protein
MSFLLAILIIYLVYFGSIYYKILLVIPIIYLSGKLIMKYKKQIMKHKKQIMKLRYSLYGSDYGYDYDSDSDLESGDSSDSEIVVDDQYIVNSDLELHLE